MDSFTNTGGARQNEGSTDVFGGTLSDSNKATDLQAIKVAITSGPVTFDSVRSLGPADFTTVVEPASFDADGWKVWLADPVEKSLSYKFQYT